MTKIMLVDDHQVIIDGLKILLPTILDCEIVAEAYNGAAAIKNMSEYNIEFIIMDIMMPGEFNGIEATRIIKEKYPGVHILCLSMMGDASSINTMMSSGADGYTVKNSSGEELKEAIGRIKSGEKYIHPSLIQFFVDSMRYGKISREMIVNEMELTIIESISEGMTTSDIARLVFRSEETVRSKRKQLLKRFSVNNSAELVGYAIRNKLIK